MNCGPNAILVISPEPWDAHNVSKHHYARTLAERGARVFFLNPPDDSQSEFKIENKKSISNLHIVSAPNIARGLRFYPSILRRWLEKRWLARFEKAIDTKIDIIWLFENSRFFDMRFAGYRLKIYHQVDLNQNFQPEVAASTADICFCTTDFIKDELLPYNSKTYKIHHGTALVKNKGQLMADQQARFNLDCPHAVYIGNLDMLYLDAELLADVVRRFPEVHFHFVGGYNEKGKLWNLASSLSNVTWWGKVDHSMIPAILDHVDILLVTYQAERYKDQASPHKFMEYLASGKVIVSTYTDEYKDKHQLLEMVERNDDFPDTFGKIVANLEKYNSPERQDARIEFARQHTYDKQLDKIFDLLKKHDLYQKIEKGNRQYDI
ncbi:glycosyltransferase [Candidatus Electrothrix aarhusensis]